MSIKLYCVGIHFSHDIDFVPDLPVYKLVDKNYVKNTDTTAAKVFMSGSSILKVAALKFGLRYKLADSAIYPQPDHIQYLSYTPTVANDPKPRVTLGPEGRRIFPFYGQPLSLIERLAPIGEVSQVLQYTVQWPKHATGPFATPAPVTLNNSGELKDDFPAPSAPIQNRGDAAFGSNGFSDSSEIRVRLLAIYCTS